ncbi:hypothetical protein D3C80_1653780 [compost metagenome]
MPGEPTAPAHRMISRRAANSCQAFCQRAFTARARVLLSSTWSTSTPVSTVRFGRLITGRRNALDAFQRTPLRWLT